MSELINNREVRREKLKSIILGLHEGLDPEEARKEFKELLDQVGPDEIMALEQSLVDGGLPVEQIAKLCDVHVAVFRESLDKAPKKQSVPDTHPLDSFVSENEAIKAVLEKTKPIVQAVIDEVPGTPVNDLLDAVRTAHARLMELDRHYTRKENLLFPYLERHGISGPSSVMWSIHDEIRQGLKEVSLILLHAEPVASEKLAAVLENTVLPLYEQIGEMIYKEENILFPTCRDLFTDKEWATIASDTRDGVNDADIQPSTDHLASRLPVSVAADDVIRFDTGFLTPGELSAIFNTLPFDITFVGADDTVRYFSDGTDRIFDRTRSVIGRKVQNCHPPSSVNVVEKILDDFKSGRRDNADFWIQSRGRFIYIRYFAVRSPEGEYLGTLEVTQDVKPIRELEGEQRIYDDSAAKA